MRPAKSKNTFSPVNGGASDVRKQNSKQLVKQLVIIYSIIVFITFCYIPQKLNKFQTSVYMTTTKYIFKNKNAEYAVIFLFIHTFFFPVISSNIHCYFYKIFHEFSVLKKLILTKTFNIDFHYKFIKFWIILFFQLFLIYICIFKQVLSKTIERCMFIFLILFFQVSLLYFLCRNLDGCRDLFTIVHSLALEKQHPVTIGNDEALFTTLTSHCS